MGRGRRGWHTGLPCPARGSDLLLQGGPGEMAQRETRKKGAGGGTRWAPASYLSCWSWPGPLQTHWSCPRPVPGAGTGWVPSCPGRWPSSPGSCCWSWAPWSAGAAAQDRGHFGPFRRAGAAGWEGEEAGRSAHQLALVPSSCSPPAALPSLHGPSARAYVLLATPSTFRTCESLWLL